MTVQQEQTQDTSWQTVDLFGGAMSANFPDRFTDLSDARPVPDHQEVWSDPATDQSIIVEVTEHSPVADADVGSFVFNDLVQANDAACSSITSVQQLEAPSIPHMPAGTHAVLVTGTFKAAKGRDTQEHANNVLLLLAIVRLPQHGTDLLVSVNAPVCVSGGSSAGVPPGVQPAAQGQAVGVMQGVLSSLRVQDWGLFGEH